MGKMKQVGKIKGCISYTMVSLCAKQALLFFSSCYNIIILSCKYIIIIIIIIMLGIFFCGHHRVRKIKI